MPKTTFVNDIHPLTKEHVSEFVKKFAKKEVEYGLTNDRTVLNCLKHSPNMTTAELHELTGIPRRLLTRACVHLVQTDEIEGTREWIASTRTQIIRYKVTGRVRPMNNVAQKVLSIFGADSNLTVLEIATLTGLSESAVRKSSAYLAKTNKLKGALPDGRMASKSNPQRYSLVITEYHRDLH
jgi:hypothetical protein